MVSFNGLGWRLLRCFVCMLALRLAVAAIAGAGVTGSGGEALHILLYIGAGALMGALCGLLPQKLGDRRHNTRLGQRGFVCCLVVGALGGPILALATAAIFAFLICRRSSANVDGAEVTGKELNMTSKAA